MTKVWCKRFKIKDRGPAEKGKFCVPQAKIEPQPFQFTASQACIYDKAVSGLGKGIRLFALTSTLSASE